MKTGKERLSSVMFTYIGTDEQFTEFLKMLIHDYLNAGKMEGPSEENCQ